MENRGGTSIEELMRGGGQNSNMNDDDDVINSILSEINSDKEQMINNQKLQEQQQMMQQQQMRQRQAQQQQQQQEMIQQQMIQKEQMMKKQMEIEKMRERDKMNQEKGDIVKMCENVSLLDEFKSSIIFFIIFMLLNLTQMDNLICGALSIENNNIFVLLKTFVATVIFFFVNKLVHKYI
tara:strand:- start:497 stop:1036 length:540 start_codon:yes stop_codon:yes gene_type:complete